MLVVLAAFTALVRTAATAGTGAFQFTPLATPFPCMPDGGNPTAPCAVRPEFGQTIVASEPASTDAGDMTR